MSQQVEADKIVSVAYTIRDGSGKIVEHTGLPVSYLHGGDDPPLFPQVTAALEGLSAGDTTEVLLRAQDHQLEFHVIHSRPTMEFLS